MFESSIGEKCSCEKYYKTVTCAEMKEIERKANESGISYYQMMENAGKSAVKIIINKVNQILVEKTLPKGSSKGVSEIENERLSKDVDVVIFCGKGNNGGDGYVVARELAISGFNVSIVMADGNPKTEDAIKNANIVINRDIPIIDAQKYFKDIPGIIEAADVVVDAIYGTGFHGNLPETVRSCTKLINENSQKTISNIKKLVFALDIPTGLNGDEGKPDKDTVKSDYTVAFHRTKPVHDLKEAAPYCGNIVAVSIGID